MGFEWMMLKPHYRCKGLDGKRRIFLILLAVVVIMAISTYQYNPFLLKRELIEVTTKQAISIKSKTDDMSETQPSVFAQRVERIHRVCASHPKLEGKVHGIFTHPSGVIYCFVPKAGCTFWKRIFHFASLGNSTEYKNPWSIPRLLVHSDKQRNGVKYDSVKHSAANFPMRFIVSRDPYSRLVSSYLDKFYLPDFWQYLGKGFAQETVEWSKKSQPDFLTHHFDSIQSLFAKNQSKERQLQCAKRLTFAAFVISLLRKPETHWMPVHSLCNPCDFKPTHIVHIESFNSDSKVILRQMGLDKIVEDFTHDEQVNEEIQTIVDYNFRRLVEGYGASHVAACISQKELAYRLWHNFVWRGYIHPDANYTIPASNTCVKDDLLKQLWRARIKGLQDKQAMKSAAKKFKSDLYSTLNQQMYEGLRKAFEMDFEFFGYDDLFKNTTLSHS